jgi:hypothetical protein
VAGSKLLQELMSESVIEKVGRAATVTTITTTTATATTASPLPVIDANAPAATTTTAPALLSPTPQRPTPPQPPSVALATVLSPDRYSTLSTTVLPANITLSAASTKSATAPKSTYVWVPPPTDPTPYDVSDEEVEAEERLRRPPTPVPSAEDAQRFVPVDSDDEAEDSSSQQLEESERPAMMRAVSVGVTEDGVEEEQEDDDGWAPSFIDDDAAAAAGSGAAGSAGAEEAAGSGWQAVFHTLESYASSARAEAVLELLQPPKQQQLLRTADADFTPISVGFGRKVLEHAPRPELPELIVPVLPILPLSDPVLAEVAAPAPAPVSAAPASNKPAPVAIAKAAAGTEDDPEPDSPGGED